MVGTLGIVVTHGHVIDYYWNIFTSTLHHCYTSRKGKKTSKEQTSFLVNLISSFSLICLHLWVLFDLFTSEGCFVLVCIQRAFELFVIFPGLQLHVDSKCLVSSTNCSHKRQIVSLKISDMQTRIFTPHWIYCCCNHQTEYNNWLPFTFRFRESSI